MLFDWCWRTVAASRVVRSSVLFLSFGLILRSFTYKFNTVSFRFWSTVGFFCCFSYQRRSFDLFSLFCVLHSTRLWISYAAMTIHQINVDRTVYSRRELFGLRRTYPGRLTGLTEILNDIAAIHRRRSHTNWWGTCPTIFRSGGGAKWAQMGHCTRALFYQVTIG